MEPWVWWVGAGILMLAAEMLLPGVFLFWIGAAAIGAGLAVLWQAWDFPAASVVFLVLLAAGIGFSWARKRVVPPVNKPGDGLVGRHVMLIEDGPAGARVRLGDSEWPARLLAPAEPGAGLVVVAVENTTLVVGAPAAQAARE